MYFLKWFNWDRIDLTDLLIQNFIADFLRNHWQLDSNTLPICHGGEDNLEKC